MGLMKTWSLKKKKTTCRNRWIEASVQTLFWSAWLSNSACCVHVLHLSCDGGFFSTVGITFLTLLTFAEVLVPLPQPFTSSTLFLPYQFVIPSSSSIIPTPLCVLHSTLSVPGCCVAVGYSSAAGLSVMLQWKHVRFRCLTPDLLQHLPAERSNMTGPTLMQW